MAFQVPASKASKGQDKFEFTIGNETFRVRRMKYLKIDRLQELETDGLEALVFFKGSGGAQQKAVGSLEGEQFEALVNAWRADSEVSEGEVPASDD